MKRVYEEIAQRIDELSRAVYPLHIETLKWIEKNKLPRGSGIDCGTKIDRDESKENKIVLLTSFHHMDEHGYDGWTNHKITIRPSLVHRFTLTISGPNRNDIKEYLYEAYWHALDAEWTSADRDDAFEFAKT